MRTAVAFAVSVEVVALAGGARAQELLHALDSQAAGGPFEFGTAVAFLGDLDGDGVPEIASGAPHEQGARGRVHVFCGRTGAPLWTFVGEPGDHAGRSIAALADVDGDGTADLVVGGTPRPGSSSRTGKAYVLSGADGTVVLALDDEESSLFGWRVAALDDVDGDGRGDFAIAAPAHDAEERDMGRVYVYSGSGALLRLVTGRTEGQQLGRSIAAAGDLDGDGRCDLLIGSRGPSGYLGPGRVEAISSATGATLLSIDGAAPDAWRFGDAVAGGTDVDGDGVPDLLIGDPLDQGGEFGSGAAFLHSGATGRRLRAWYSEIPNQHLGIAVAFAGDGNGDGVVDVLLGEEHPVSPGRAHLHSGADGSLLYRLEEGSRDANAFGSAVADGSDLDGDGLSEVAVSAPLDSTLKPAAGRVFAFRGNDLYLQAQPRQARAGVTLKLGTRAREPFVLALLAVVAIDATATFMPVDVGRVGDDGRRLLSATVPPGLSGLAIDFQAFALDSRAGVADSVRERVEFR